MPHAIFSSAVFTIAVVLLVGGSAGRPGVAAAGDGRDSCGQDWLTMPGPYSHDPVSGQRVSQYAQVEAPKVPVDPTFRSSGYTHLRSTLAYGQSADNYHRVESWGDPVRPYGEWRFPYRPFSTPYPNWGPPFAGFNLGFGFPQPGFPPPRRPGNGGGGGNGNGNGNGTSTYPGNGGYNGRPDWGRRPRPTPPPASPFNPYPAGPGSPYPVAPYYDGYYPPYRD